MKKSFRSRHTHSILALAACTGGFTIRALAQDVELPPLNGFQPLVIFGMTNEQWPSDFSLNSFTAQTSSTPGNNPNSVGNQTLPLGGQEQYFVAVVDTGAQSSIITQQTADAVDLEDANLMGDGTEEILGASGTETTGISNAMGFYMSSLNNAQVTNGNLGLMSGAPVNGMWNTSALVTQPGSVLPNIMGSPTIGLYQVSIKNSQPVHVTVGGTTYQSPLVGFTAQNTAVSNSYGKVALSTTDNIGGAPAFEPSFEDFNNTGDNTATPTLWESIFANVKVSHTVGSETDSFMLDTGAQVSVLSSQTAADIGIYTTGDNPTKPDFYTEITGVGGSQEQVPGYYIQGMSLTTTSGPINFSRVPVIVLDLPDPRNPNQELPGVLGTNLFTDRDLVINIGTGNSFLYISPEWMWKTNGSGSWGTATNWNLALPNGVDTQANFFSAITSPATITVDSSGFTVGSLAFNNTNRYTLAGTGTISMAVSAGQAQINVLNGSHTITAPISFNNDTTITILPSNGSLNISSTFINASGANLDLEGAGTLAMTYLRAQTMTINGGALMINPNGGAAGASHVMGLTIAGGTTPTAMLDLTNNAMVIDYAPGNSPLATIAAQVKAGSANGWTGQGITSSLAAAVSADSTNHHKTAIGYAEDSAVGNLGTFLGQPADSTSILLRYTFDGDANLDGTVNALDFNALASNYGSGRYWFQGDFNNDGTINSNDFALLAGNFGQVMPAAGDFVPAASVVPEPCLGGVMMLIMLSIPRQRKRGWISAIPA